jgi:hypothetical protein
MKRRTCIVISRIYGDDVDELFLELSEEFDISLEGIDLRGCFPGEPHLFNPFPTLLFRPKRRVRIRHLVDAVLLKKWPAPEAVP